MSLLNAPQSYLYGEYRDDPDLRATRTAYNQEANGIFQWMQQNPVADYRSSAVGSNLLDWVGLGLYNMSRKVLVSSSGGGATGSFGDVVMGHSPFAGGKITAPTSLALNLSDDQYRRAITWTIYAGDGWVFNTDWLRRRIARFMFVADGYGEFQVADLQLISIQWIGLRSANVFITAPAMSSALALILSVGLSTGYLQIPLGYTINITLLNYQTAATDFGGDIL